MEMYIEQGVSRMDCELKIAEKYRRPFHVLSEKEIKVGGFLGFFSKPGVQVEFYFPSASYRKPQAQNSHVNTLNYFSPADIEKRPVIQQPVDLEEEKRKVLAAAGRNYDQIAASGRESSQQILDSLKEIMNKIETGEKKDEHPAFKEVKELLKSNDFSDNYISGMLERLRKEMPLAELDNFKIVQERLLEWIGESINIYAEDKNIRKPRIIVLVGPTGVGKTTTIAKLAAIYGIGTDEIPAVEVKMITIDAFRICAKEQLESIGSIMRIPVTFVIDKQSLRKEIALCSDDTDMVFIDTIGKSPKDSSKLGEMKEILEGAGRGAEFHLVISAATKTSDIEDILRQFEPFNYKSVVLTKVDETDHIGNIISALAEKRKSISYVTDGQDVPVDIRKATVMRFLTNLDGFKVNSDKLEKRFPSGEADQFKWR
ncbi:MAG: AAA family ATPase [Treponema sp.]|jgi:flagellar biosynthesis protein FlhF|nr:AAA family ATPase [Treponema sp.]